MITEAEKQESRSFIGKLVRETHRLIDVRYFTTNVAIIDESYLSQIPLIITIATLREI